MSDEKSRSVPSRENHDGADNVTPSTEGAYDLEDIMPSNLPKQSGGGSSSGDSSGGSSGGDKKD